MKQVIPLLLLAAVLSGCASNARFIQTDETYVVAPKPEGTNIVFRRDAIRRQHRVIGVLEAELGRRASRADLNALLIKKAREIGADGVMLVEYDVDRQVYYDRHHTVVGRWNRRHVVRTRRRVDVDKTATGVAVVFQ
ncbi:MAG: hypothetical protein ACE5G0_08190 [Rhodothermales bacterium]